MFSKPLLWSLLFSMLVGASFSAQCQLQAITDPENIVANRLAGSWELSIFLTQRLHATNYFQFSAPLEFSSVHSVVSAIPKKYDRQLYDKKIYMAGYMKTPEWQRPFVLIQANGNPQLIVFVRKGGDEMADAIYFTVMLAQGRNKQDDILFIKKRSSQDPFYALERAKRYAKTNDGPKETIKKSGKHRKQRSRWYACYIDGIHAGYVYIIKKKSSEKRQFSFSHKISIDNRGITIAYDLLTFCKDDDYLSPVKIISKGKGNSREAFPSFVARIDNNQKLKTRLYGEPFELFLPGRTVFSPLLWEIVPRLPFDNKRAFYFHYLEIEEFVLRKNHKIVYVGKEKVKIDGLKRELHKFKHTGEDFPVVYYWVDDERNLVRVLMEDGREFILTSKRKALHG